MECQGCNKEISYCYCEACLDNQNEMNYKEGVENGYAKGFNGGQEKTIKRIKELDIPNFINERYTAQINKAVKHLSKEKNTIDQIEEILNDLMDEPTRAIAIDIYNQLPSEAKVDVEVENYWEVDIIDVERILLRDYKHLTGVV